MKTSIENVLYGVSKNFLHASTWAINKRTRWLYRLHKWATRNEQEGVFQIPYGGLKGTFIDNKPGKFSTLDVFSLDEILLQVIFKKIVTSDSVVWDVGANIGLHTLYISPLAKNVVAFEPDKAHLKFLKRNISLNGLGNITVVSKALFSKDGTLFFDNSGDNTSKGHVAEAGIKIEGTRGDTFLADHPRLAPDVLKIDVEGQAHNTLKGMGKYLKDAKYVVCELHSKEESNGVYTILKENNFRILGQNLLWREVRDITEMPASVWDGHIVAINEKHNDSAFSR